MTDRNSPRRTANDTSSTAFKGRPGVWNCLARLSTTSTRSAAVLDGRAGRVAASWCAMLTPGRRRS